MDIHRISYVTNGYPMFAKASDRYVLIQDCILLERGLSVPTWGRSKPPSLNLRNSAILDRLDLWFDAMDSLGRQVLERGRKLQNS
jgi:hypothetical protein